MFKRKWHWTCSAVIVVCIGSIAFFLQSKTEIQEPIKVYKAVIPDPKQSLPKPNMEETTMATPPIYAHGHEHLHETAPYFQAQKTTINGSEYDWQDDGVFDSSSPKVDPWEQTLPEHGTIETDDDTYPHRDWYKTKDPELRAEYLYAQLIKQFGDTPEVQAIGEYELKAAQGIPPTLEEYTVYLEAHYHLFPNKQNQQTLNNLRKAIASGHKIIFE
ncbi:MAG: hypothetical protein OXN25_09435 [Candidatus Poribacteria bacterium]|nr:hypothetical protein [Candidatus Poribacteria bacterium]